MLDHYTFGLYHIFLRITYIKKNLAVKWECTRLYANFALMWCFMVHVLWIYTSRQCSPSAKNFRNYFRCYMQLIPQVISIFFCHFKGVVIRGMAYTHKDRVVCHDTVWPSLISYKGILLGKQVPTAPHGNCCIQADTSTTCQVHLASPTVCIIIFARCLGHSCFWQCESGALWHSCPSHAVSLQIEHTAYLLSISSVVASDWWRQCLWASGQEGREYKMDS